MKTILVPTDFSDASKNAAEYAVELAKKVNAGVVLLHVFHIPMVASDAPVIVPSFDELEHDNVTLLKELENELRLKHNFTRFVDCIAKPGFVTDEIADTVKEKNVDLIVMGIVGAGKLSEFVLGSNSTDLIRTANTPTLVVPYGVKYNPVNTIVFACDLENVQDNNALQQVKTFVQLFNARLMILSVVDPSEKPNFEKAVSGMKLSTIFENINHSLHFPEDKDLINTINEFIDTHNADLLIMLPQKHSFLSRMFRESNTKKMAFHTHIPLLAIHD